MITFEAIYDPEGAANAERAFYVRSVKELRRWQTFGPPVAFAVVVLTAFVLQAPVWFTFLFGAALALSVAGPVLFYFARPRAAGQLARSHPIRQISLTPSAIEITAGDRKSVIGWERIKHIWIAGDYLLLVLGRFAAVSIPQRCLPSGANEFISASAKHAA